MSVAESMALGKIVIATNVGAVSEMFHDKSTGYLFQRDDLNQLVQLLMELHPRTNPTRKEQIRSEANDKYNPVEVARRTVDFYRSVINMQ